jgi:tetratricopeptide (TPR) repeat protein
VRFSELARRGFDLESMYVAQLGDSYAILAQCLGLLDRHGEARAPLDKLIAISEEYSRAHPDDELGLRGLAKAYINSAITDDPAETLAQKLARAEPLFLKAMAVQEQLVAREPERALYRWNLGETQYNYGDVLFDDGQHTAALVLFRKAAAAFAGFDPADARQVLINAMNEVNLAKALGSAGSYREAEAVISKVEPVLRQLLADGSTLQVEWALAQLGIARGTLYSRFAQDERRPVNERRRYWARARDSLSEANQYCESVNKAFTLFGVYKDTWDTGLATLARAEAALAKSST